VDVLEDWSRDVLRLYVQADLALTLIEREVAVPVPFGSPVDTGGTSFAPLKSALSGRPPADAPLVSATSAATASRSAADRRIRISITLPGSTLAWASLSADD
jgi:hypothetical protein